MDGSENSIDFFFLGAGRSAFEVGLTGCRSGWRRKNEKQHKGETKLEAEVERPGKEFEEKGRATVAGGLTDDLQNAPYILPLTPLRFNPKPTPDDIDAVEPPYSDKTGEGGVPVFGRGQEGG